MAAKKAKPSPKTGKLLVHVKKAIQKALEGKLFEQASSLPEVDVPITSMKINAALKKLKVPPEFLAALQQGNDEIFKNTKVLKIDEVTDLKLMEIAGVPTLVGKGTFQKDETPDLTHVPSSEELVAQLLKDTAEAVKKEAEEAVKKGKLVGFKASDFQNSFYPLGYTTPPIVPLPFSKTFPMTGASPLEDMEDELVAWMDNTVTGVLDYLKFEAFDATTLIQARSLIAKHYADTAASGGIGPPALFCGEERIVYRTGLRLCHALESLHGQFTPLQVKAFNEVFPFPALGKPEPHTSTSPMDLLATIQEIADWMRNVVKIIFDFIHWQPISKKLLLDVRRYIEEGYEGDLLPRFPVGFNVSKKFPKAGVVHHVAVRLWYMLEEKNSQLSDKGAVLFAEVFPLPDPSDLLAFDKVGPPGVLNKNGRIYPASLWKGVVKKLQPKFSKEAAEDAKAAGLDESVIMDSLSPGIIPAEHVVVDLVIDKEGNPFVETTWNGEIVGKHPVTITGEQLTAKGFATLNRFGAVLKVV